MTIQSKLTIIDQQSIAKYLQDIRIDPECEPMTSEMEASLFTAHKISGDPNIKRRLIKANLRFVVTVAKQYDYSKSRLEDRINEGNIGLIKAFDRFDVTKGNSFLTFATWYIRTEIRQYAEEVVADIVQPANRFRINKVMKQAEKEFIKKGNYSPSPQQLMEEYAKLKDPTDPVLTIHLWNEIQAQNKNFISFETPLSDADQFSLGDTFKSGSEYYADAAFTKDERREGILKVLSVTLTDRERTIVQYRFGLDGYDEKTLDQIAEIMGFTRERIGQLLQGALKKLRTERKVLMELMGSSKETAHSIEANHASTAMAGLHYN